MGRNKNKGGQQQQGQNQQGQQQQQPAPPKPTRKEKKGPVIYCYESWDGNVCTVTFAITNEKGESIKDGALQIFGDGIAPLSLLKIDENGSAIYQIAVKKELTFGVMLLGTPASTWVKLFNPMSEQETVSQMSASCFRM